MPSCKLKLLYDGECPYCRRGVAWLKRRDRAGRLAFEDITAVGFDPGKYGLTRDAVMRSLHGVRPDGTVVKGMDAIREACRAVGRGWLVAPTRLPLLRGASNALYRAFSHWRGPMGQLVGGCSDGSCSVRRPDQTKHKTPM
jgi:predicted DCC family thiol-disulfide oxidoreductase YuxK